MDFAASDWARTFLRRFLHSSHPCDGFPRNPRDDMTVFSIDMHFVQAGTCLENRNARRSQNRSHRHESFESFEFPTHIQYASPDWITRALLPTPRLDRSTAYRSSKTHTAVRLLAASLPTADGQLACRGRADGVACFCLSFHGSACATDSSP